MKHKLFVLMVMAALVAMVASAPAALAQDVKAEALPGGKANAQAGDAVKSKADPECAEAVAGGTAAKACPGEKKAPPPPPPPKKPAPAPAPKPAPAPAPPAKAAPAPAPAPAPPAKAEAKKKALPPSGGAGVASVAALGAGALLVGGGLLFRRLLR